MAQALKPPPPPSRTIALLPWGNVIEDFLDPIGLDLAAFCARMSGGWLFGYVDALRLAGWRAVLVCVSRDATSPCRMVHAPSGTAVHVLPVPASYRRLVSGMRDPYGWSVADSFGPLAGFARRRARLRRELAPYCATPLRSLARLLRSEKCSAVLVQEYEWPRFDLVALLGRVLRLPVYASFQGGDGHPPGIEDTVRPHTLRLARGFAIATTHERTRLAARYAIPVERLHRVQNPVDLALWRAEGRDAMRLELGLPAGARVAVWHGRVEMRRKGLDVLLDAWIRLIAAAPGADRRLLLIGSGADDAVLRARLAEPALASVRWLPGYELDRAVMRRYLSAADCYALASRLEGLPVAPLEAMACGLPLVASDIPPMRDILEGGLDAGGVTVGVDDPAAFAAALGRFLDDPALALATGRNARATVEARFSVEAVAEQLGAMLRRG